MLCKGRNICSVNNFYVIPNLIVKGKEENKQIVSAWSKVSLATILGKQDGRLITESIIYSTGQRIWLSHRPEVICI